MTPEFPSLPDPRPDTTPLPTALIVPKVHILLAEEARWGIGRYAYENYKAAWGTELQGCPPRHPAACKWCLAGAVYRCYPKRQNLTEYDLATNPDQPTVESVMRKLAEWIVARYPGIYNDYIRHIHSGCENIVTNWNDTPGRTFEEIRMAAVECDI